MSLAVSGLDRYDPKMTTKLGFIFLNFFAKEEKFELCSRLRVA